MAQKKDPRNHRTNLATWPNVRYVVGMHNLTENNQAIYLCIYAGDDGFPSFYYIGEKKAKIRFNHPARPRYNEIDAAALKRFQKMLATVDYVYVPTDAANAFHTLEDALESLAELEAK